MAGTRDGWLVREGRGAASSSRRQRHRSAWGASSGTKGRQARASLRARQTRAIGCNAGPAGGQQRSQRCSVGWRSGADAGNAARGRRGFRLAHRVDGGSPGKRATIPEQADGAPQMPPAGLEVPEDRCQGCPNLVCDQRGYFPQSGQPFEASRLLLSLEELSKSSRAVRPWPVLSFPGARH
jgi:hypothetical protein